MAEAAQIQSDDWKDIPSAETASPYTHGDDWHDIVPPPVSYDEFAGPKVTETPLYRAGESVQKFGRETFPVSEEERAAHPFASAIGRGAGAMVPAVAATLTAGPAGALAGAAQMGMSSGADVFDDALSKGATEEQAAKAAGATGALSAAIGVLPLGAILAPIRQKLPGMAGWAMAKLTQAAVNGVTFATVGEAQQWLTTEVEKAYYDPNAHYDPQFKDMLASFIVGGAFGTMHPLHRPGQEAGAPAEAPPLEGEVLPPERGTVPPPGSGKEAPTIEGEAVGAPRPAEAPPEGLPAPARALPPPGEVASEPPLQAYESAPPEQIRNPVTGTPEEKVAQLGKLTAENKPIIQDLMKDIDDRFGTKSSDNVKTDANILLKSQRPSILAKKPWFGVEYVRDSYRFKTMMDTLFDVPDIVDMLKERGISVVKSDVVKQFHPGELGWRISAFDLQMPNGQLVEYYLPVKEMEFAKDEGHEIFEKWRNLDLKKLTPEQIVTYEQDIQRSRNIYQNAWEAYLARTGDDPKALRAALSKIDASPSGTTRNVPLNVSSAENAIPGSQAPLTREAAQPESSTSTSPSSSRAISAISASKENIRAAREYDNQGVDIPTRNLLDKKGVPYTVEDFRPSDIKADPARFQFRGNADERTGETEEHAIPPEKWRGQATPLIVWRDNQGQAWIVDGHHRLAIAKRIAPDERLRSIVLNEADLTASAARNFGKTRNEVRDAYRNLSKGIVDPKLGSRAMRYIRDLLNIEETGFRLPDQSPQETHAPDLFGPSAGTPHRVTAADGSAVDVHPIVVEASRPITSQDQGYDQSLQPRQRSRAASQQQVRDIATNLDPERLGYSAEADRGAPIIGSDGMVESGNGRVLALRRAYEQGGPQAKAYRDWLAQQGVDVSKFRNPIMVRRRLTPLTPDQRRAFTVAANQPTTLAMSAPERAMADARLIDTNSLNLIVNPDDLSRNRDFTRKFIAQLPQTEQGAMADAHGALSSEGATRIRNAVLAKAYGDAGVLTRIAESTNDEIKSISNALVGAAPRWAKMRAEIEAGNVRRDMDLTPELISAVQRTADIRAKGQKLNEYLAQIDAFDKLPGSVEAFMRGFYDAKGRRAASAEKVRDALRFYADEAAKVSADKGLDLGLVPVAPHDILNLAQKRDEDGRQRQDAERRGAGAGQGSPAGGGEARGPFLGAGVEYTGEEGQAGYPEAAERAQRPERVTGPLEELIARTQDETERRETEVRRLTSAGRPVRLEKADDKNALVSQGPENGKWRLTRFDDRGPIGHTEYSSMDGAIRDALREGYAVTSAKKDKAPSLPGFEPVSSAEVAKRRANEPLRPRVAQEPPSGLFAHQGQQLSLEEFIDHVSDVKAQRPEEEAKPSAPPFYSAVLRGVESAKQPKASPQQWLGMLKNMPGLKAEELEWLGLEDWIRQQKSPITKEQIADYVRANQIEVKEVEKGESSERRASQERVNELGRLGPDRTPEQEREYNRLSQRLTAGQERGGEPKFASYTLPGGESYRELLLTLPPKADTTQLPDGYRLEKGMLNGKDRYEVYGPGTGRYASGDTPEQAIASFHRQHPSAETFKSPHWEEPNIVAHVRFNERTVDSKKTLFVEELQSDWMQKGKREGFKPSEAEYQAKQDAFKKQLEDITREISTQPFPSPERHRELHRMEAEITDQYNALHDAHDRGVPSAPFKTTWPELAMKRMIRYAAENGYDKIAWTSGETQAARYDLSKQISKITFQKQNNRATGNLVAYDHNGRGVIDRDITDPERELPDIIGKEAAEKLLGQEKKRDQEIGPPEKRMQWRETQTLEGLDLKVGGEGMRGFYDQILPATVNKLVKKYGAKAGDGNLPAAPGDVDKLYGIRRDDDGRFEVWERRTRDPVATFGTHDEAVREMERLGREQAKGVPVHVVDLTDKLKDVATQEGFPLFKAPSGWEAAEGHGEPQGEKVRIGRDTYAYVNPKYTAKEQEIANAVMDIGARMAPKANIKGVAALRMSGSPIWGGFINSKAFPQLITWSLEKGDARQIGQTVRHEIIHHLRNAGLFKAEEWKALRDAAVNDGWLQKHRIYDRYPDLSSDHKVEEAVAEEFAKWRAERSLVKPGPIRDAFMRLDLFLRRVAAAVRKAMGFNATPADIFTRIETGEVGRREPIKRASGGRVESGTGKRTRDSFGYMEPSPNIPDFAQCGSCQMWIKARGRCYWFSDDKKVEANDSCTEYVQGEPIKGNVKATNSLDPKEAGFIKGSTRCENCVSLDKAKHTCMLFEKLNRTQPAIFDLDEHVKPRGCCNAFSRDPARHEKVVRRASGGRVDAKNINSNPTEAQKDSGVYAKDHLHRHGLPITIENAKGSIRRGVDNDGRPWQARLGAHYGYLKRTEGSDGDHLDVYLGDNPKSQKVFAIDQVDADTGKWDEHKICLSFASKAQALGAYERSFSDGKANDRIGHVTEMTMDQFRDWLGNGDTKKPLSGTSHAPKIDTTHTVPWMSEMSKSGDTYYRDRSLPSRIINNKKWLPIDEPLKRHEIAEFNAIKRMTEEFEAKHGRKPNDAEREAIYLKCHKEHGEVAEHNWLKENGYDVKAWESWCHGQLAHLEHKRVAKPVPNPHVRPSPHDRRRLEETL